MELGEALAQIDAIRAQVARAAVFRGYKAATVASTGLLALLAAAVQPLVIPEPAADVARYLQLWIGVAAVSALGVAVELVIRCRRTDSRLQREQTLLAVEQFVPCLVAGAGMTGALVQSTPEAVFLLPGLWAILFSLGIFASCRQLPRPAVGVGAYYLVTGVACLAIARNEHALSPWTMAGTFGVGQLLTAAVLYLSLERHDAHR